ncbi:hypothetical protein [Gulosibacter faecalis]|uniref:Uncharacterized protein n=1 Tax=Gulosibacter faecalis TaxID=272240 RepID=A0ABW5V060_9MICO|nr:hypothetical protein [Gulosibacter faecalis]
MTKSLTFANAEEFGNDVIDEAVLHLGSVKFRAKLWQHPSNRNDLIVIVDDAISLTAGGEPDGFDGEGLFGQVDASVLCISDDWLDEHDVRQPGWAQGEFHQYLLPTLHHFVESVRTKFGFVRRVVACGTGSGAFVSLQLGALVRATHAVIANPVLDLSLTRNLAITTMIHRSYPGLDLATVKARFAERISVPKSIKNVGYLPAVHCSVNPAIARVLRRQVPLLLRTAGQVSESNPDVRVEVLVDSSAFIGNRFFSQPTTHRAVNAALGSEGAA